MDESTMRQILSQVRTFISAGDGNSALACLLHAVRLSHPEGEDGIFSFLDMAKELISLQRSKDEDDEMAEALREVEKLVNAQSLLGEYGEGHILRDAFCDGSSIICKKCDSLVKRERWDAHATKWCSAIQGGDLDSDDDDT